jgi:protein SCO1/2
VLAGLLVLAGLAAQTGCSGPADPVTVQRQGDPGGYLAGTSLPDPYELPAKTLTDSTGRPYNLVSSPSRPVMLLFFGYTHCPDVCVAVLSEVATALQRSDPGVRDQIQVVFITTDPARDSPAVIGKYLDRFDPGFVGLTADLSEIKAIAARVGVDISGQQKLPSGGYEVGHSAQVIGFDSAHRGVVLWTPSNSVADLKHDYALLVERAR